MKKILRRWLPASGTGWNRDRFTQSFFLSSAAFFQPLRPCLIVPKMCLKFDKSGQKEKTGDWKSRFLTGPEFTWISTNLIELRELWIKIPLRPFFGQFFSITKKLSRLQKKWARQKRLYPIVPKLCPSRSKVNKHFQTKPKTVSKSDVESTCCNYGFF